MAKNKNFRKLLRERNIKAQGVSRTVGRKRKIGGLLDEQSQSPVNAIHNRDGKAL